jgi:rRNA biogenesis protein RRP5
MKRNADEPEEAFPRGKPIVEGVQARGNAFAAIDAAAADRGDEEEGGDDDEKGARPKGDKTRNRNRKKGKDAPEDDVDVLIGPGGTVQPQAVTSVPRLRITDLDEGTLLVAAVRDVHDDEICLNLPFHAVGYVSRAQATEARFNDVEDMSKLPELFQPGQLVVAVVMSISEKDNSHAFRIDLSLRPSVINAGLTAETLAQHMCLPATVESDEEHVLRLDFGVEGFHGQLKKTELAGMSSAPRIGSILQITAQAVNAAKGSIRCSLAAGSPEKLGGDAVPMNALKAGFLVNCRIDKAVPAKSDDESNSGLVVTFCSMLTGFIHTHHQWQGLGKHAPEFEKRQIVQARVLAVVPGSQVIVHLSILPHLVEWKTNAEAITNVSIGDRLEAQVLDSVPKFGVRLKCTLPSQATASSSSSSRGTPCFCPVSRLADKESRDSKSDGVEMPKAGAKVECRVLGHNFLESALVVTRRPYDLKEDTLISVTELEPGQLVVGSIARITEFGVFAKLSEYVSGLVHLRHLTDVPLAKVSEKHQVGQKIKCRVLNVSAAKRQVSLTAKKSLVKDTFQLVSFEQARKDMLVTGYVKAMKDYGAIVCFYGEMHALIPKEEMKTQEAPAIGMAVRCRISQVNRKRKRIGLSLDTENGKDAAEFTGLEADVAEGSEPGALVSEVVALQCVDEGVLVQFRTKRSGEMDLKGFVPVAHLSDNLEQAKAQHAKLTKKLAKGGAEAARLDDGVVLARRFSPGGKKQEGDEKETTAKGEQDQLPAAGLLSLKPSLRLAAVDGAFVTDLGQLQESRLYTGYVKDVFDFGAIVSVGAWKVAGIAPKHQISEQFVEKPSEVLTPGETVRLRAGKIDTEKKRFNVDLRSSAGAPADAPLLQREAEALRLYFDAQSRLAPKEAASEPWASELRPGSVLDATVTATKPYGVLLSLDKHTGLTALVLKENMPENVAPIEGESLKCAVLDFDIAGKIVDASLQPELVAGGASGAISASTSSKKRKRKGGGDAVDEAATKELLVMPALQKPAYSVVWSSNPPGVLFVPPWEKQRRWATPLQAVVHCEPSSTETTAFSRLVARCPIGGESERRKGGQRVPSIMRPAEELTIGAPIMMKVQAIKGLQVVCHAPVGIRGHIHATQLQDYSAEIAGTQPLDAFGSKRIIEARILHMKQHGDGHNGKIWHLELTQRATLMQARDTCDYEAAAVKWSILKVGTRWPVVICEVKKNFLWVELSPSVRGQVAILDATDDLAALKAPVDHFKVGQVFEAQVLRVISAQKKLDMALTGDCLGPPPTGNAVARLLKVEEVKGRGVAATFALPGRRRGFVHVTELFDFWAQFPLRRLKPGMFYEVNILKSTAGGSGEDSRVELSLRASATHGQAEAANEKRPLSAADLTPGQKVSGYVVNANDKGVFVALSRSLTGRIKLKSLSDQVVIKDTVAQMHPVGELMQDITVVEADAATGRVELSLRKGAKGRLTVEQLSVGDIVQGRVRGVERYGLFVRLDNSNLDVLVHKTEISDTPSVSLDSFQVGSPIPRAKVVKIEGNKINATIKPSEFDDDGDADMSDEEDEDAEVDAPAAPTTAAETAAEACEEDFYEEEEEGPPRKKSKADKKADKKAEWREKKEAALKPAAKPAAAVDSDDEVPWARAAGGEGAGKAAASAVSDAAFHFAEFSAAVDSGSEDGGEGEDEDSDAGDAEEAGRSTKRQKKAQKAAEAKELQQREKENADGSRATDPRSIEDFERMLLTQGDTSIIWIRYMAFHLKMSDLERARQVAERAVKHVGFSEAKERFNVWVAYMNLECTFGTDESAEAIFKRAAAHNDAKQVHMQLARIHERNKKPELAIKVYEMSCRKFAQSQKVWLALLTFMYGQNDLEGGRKTLPKCLAALPRRKHPLVVSKAALLEYQQGSAERGRSIFEGLLDSYPKRTDLWSVYIDAHIKAHTPPKVNKAELGEVRSLLERCCASRLKVAKMRFFFKRWLDFEKRFGDAESQELVRGKAREFVEGQAA